MADTESKSIFDTEPDDARETRLDAEAATDYTAGRVVPHAKVVEWLKSRGTSDELPCPEPESRRTPLSGQRQLWAIFGSFARTSGNSTQKLPAI